MHDLKTLCFLLENEVSRVANKNDISPNELENMYKAVKTMYYIKVIEAMENAKDDYGYSGRRMSISYDGRPQFDNMNSYGGNNEKMEMKRHLERALEMASTPEDRQNLMNLLSKY